MTDTNSRKGKRERQSDYPNWFTRIILALVGAMALLLFGNMNATLTDIKIDLRETLAIVHDLDKRVTVLETVDQEARR